MSTIRNLGPGAAFLDGINAAAKHAQDTLALTRSIESIAAAANRLSVPLVTIPFSNPIEDVLRQQEAHLATIRSMAALDIVKAVDGFRPAIFDVREMLNRRCAQLAPEKQRVLRYLAVRGWHLSLDMPWWDEDLAKLVVSEDAAAVDAYMADLVAENLDLILDRVSDRYPARAGIVREAAENYFDGRYATTVPAVLTQTDGICGQVLGVSAFAKVKKTKVPMTARKIEAHVATATAASSDALVEWALADLLPLQVASSLLVDTADRDEIRKSDPSYGPLNRHGVLHGIDTDFGTRENALRAFAVLGYFACLEEMLGLA